MSTVHGWSWSARLAVAVALLGCHGRAHPAVAPDDRDRGCAAELLATDAIDVAPEPRICVPLRDALARLGPATRAVARALVIVRDARGPCADQCPDLAAALMSDAALAYYRVGRHELHVVDATFAGPRWRSGPPSPAALRTYLDGLGLADWAALVARVRALPGVTLPAVVPEGSPLVLDAIVRRGPAVLLGGDVALPDLLIHELGHAVLLRDALESVRVAAWASLTGWTEDDDTRADGYVGGSFSGEQAIVASRLVLGLPRGAGTSYRPGGAGLATGYAAFDPVEDHAESFRLVHADPVALGAAAPAKLLVLAAGEVDLRAPALRRFIRPGVAALLAPEVDPVLAMATVRAHGDALLPEAAALADPRPLALPDDLHPEVRAALDDAALVVTIGRLQFRPSDAAIAALIASWERQRADLEEFQQGLDALRGE
ncbi:MAG: hypothetical protein IPL61_15495 [Myxococcales bacterium]|nr:hypothetical protein [Myxococcales bacterium]